MLATTGWNTSSLPADVQAAGTITLLSGKEPLSQAVTLKARGRTQMRIDRDSGSAVIYDGQRGAAIQGTNARRIPGHTLVARRTLAFPFMTDLVAYDDPGVELVYQGLEDVAGEQAHKIEMVRMPDIPESMMENMRRVVKITIWVSGTSQLPLQIEYGRVAYDNPWAVLPVTRTLGDYRSLSGLLVPFRQQVFIGGELRRALQLEQVDFNTGLSDRDFVVPVVVQ